MRPLRGRRTLAVFVGGVAPGRIVAVMLSSEDASYVHAVLRVKWARQVHRGPATRECGTLKVHARNNIFNTIYKIGTTIGNYVGKILSQLRKIIIKVIKKTI